MKRVTGFRCVVVSLVILFLASSTSLPVSVLAQVDGQQPCSDAPPIRLSIGMHGQATLTSTAGIPIKLGEEPSTSSDVLAAMPDGAEFEVIDGPVCADGYNWWRLRLADGLVGWAAEGIASAYWLEPKNSGIGDTLLRTPDVDTAPTSEFIPGIWTNSSARYITGVLLLCPNGRYLYPKDEAIEEGTYTIIGPDRVHIESDFIEPGCRGHRSVDRVISQQPDGTFCLDDRCDYEWLPDGSDQVINFGLCEQPPYDFSYDVTCGNAPSSRLVGMGFGRNVYGLGDTRVRREPGGAVVGTLAEGETFRLVCHPICQQSASGSWINWWRIELADGTIGYAPEGSDGVYWLEPIESENSQPAITSSTTCSGASDCSVTCGDGSTFDDTCPANGLFASCEDWQVEACRDRGGVENGLSRAIRLIGADNLEAMNATGTGQTIVMIDTGFETGHPFLDGRAIRDAEACFSGSRRSNGATVCPNGEQSMVGPGAAVPSECWARDISLCDHGTRSAGIAIGGGDDYEFHGVAPDANVIAIQASTLFGASIIPTRVCDGSSPCIKILPEHVIDALEYVLELIRSNEYEIAAVYINVQVPCDERGWNELIDQIVSEGVAVIAPAGNSGRADGELSPSEGISGPACLESVISVGSTNAQDDVAIDFSNTGVGLDLLAPGERIYSPTLLSGFDEEYGIGTSFSGPFVAGAFAAIRSRLPNATADQILEALQCTGRPRQDTRNLVITPRIRVDTALGALLGEYFVPADDPVALESAQWAISLGCGVGSDRITFIE